MSLRNNVALFSAVLFLSCMVESTAFCSDNPVIKFYQDHISAVDGNRCPMHPTCSAYASKAFKKHGAVMGWIMSLDRLVRCGRDESKVAPQIYIHAQSYIHDPLEANDYWWFKKEKTP